jgi:mannose-6-phosphate isomerase-like protein (cupin superfamily)
VGDTSFGNARALQVDRDLSRIVQHAPSNGEVLPSARGGRSLRAVLRAGGWRRSVRSWKVFVLGIVLGVLPHGASSAGPPAAPRYTIDNCVNTFSLAAAEKTSAGHQYWLFDKNFADGETLKLSIVGPHLATHAPHRHAEDEFFYVLEGQAEFFLDGKTRVVGPNTGLYCPSWMEHGIRNAGDSELRYLVIKKSPPTKP